MDEGYIKYRCRWIKSGPIQDKELVDINKWREALFKLGLIGSYENKVGFGNISIRISDKSQFIISGTQTGHLPLLNGRHYAVVLDFDFTTNSLTCKGPIKASSESLTHAALYTCSSTINSVIHIHNYEIWKNLMYKIPTTNQDVKYGTPEMSYEIIRLYNIINSCETKMFIMAGHESGVISFGNDLEEAGNTILYYIGQ